MGQERKGESSSGATYQVFLSFRGHDTRQGFADVLYHALIRDGIRVFGDNEEIPKGEDIGDEILGAIRESSIFVPIFSRGHATSKWSLVELSEMVKSMDEAPESSKKILPILYNVGADDVKLRTELYVEALRKHTEKFSLEMVQVWEDSLPRVGKIDCHELKDRG